MSKDISDFQFCDLDIFWGNRLHAITMHEIKELKYSARIKEIVNNFGSHKFIVLDQMHSDRGVCVEDLTHVHDESWFEYQGDFIITRQSRYGLIILTADCLPVIFYDSVQRVIAVVHVGWKGNSLGITQKVLIKMQEKYAVHLSDVKCFLGFGAGPCCYEVTLDFLNHFKHFDYGQNCFINKNGKIYFDNRLHVHDGLKKFGIPDENIYTTKELCTICNKQFCSARRDKQQAERQITFVALR